MTVLTQSGFFSNTRKLGIEICSPKDYYGTFPPAPEGE